MTPKEFVEKMCGLYGGTEAMTKHVIAETAKEIKRFQYTGCNCYECKRHRDVCDQFIQACEVE